MDLGLEKYINPATIEKFIRIVFILIIGISSIQMIAFMLRRSLRKQLSPQRMMLITRTIVYTGYIGLILIVMRELNYDLTALFGAAGVVGPNPVPHRMITSPGLAATLVVPGNVPFFAARLKSWRVATA